MYVRIIALTLAWLCTSTTALAQQPPSTPSPQNTIITGGAKEMRFGAAEFAMLSRGWKTEKARFEAALVKVETSDGQLRALASYVKIYWAKTNPQESQRTLYVLKELELASSRVLTERYYQTTQLAFAAMRDGKSQEEILTILDNGRKALDNDRRELRQKIENNEAFIKFADREFEEELQKKLQKGPPPKN